MYGMVNEGLHAFIVENHGPEAWEAICTNAGHSGVRFEQLTTYDDAVTYDLVAAVCDFTGLRVADALEAFGRYWVMYAGGSSFGPLMRAAGRTFVERVRGLDDMHERILLSMPHLKPPSFEIEARGDDLYHLSYFSERPALAPMVVGLLYGMAEETGEQIAVTQIGEKSAVDKADVFEIRILGPKA